jgi:hypothetical protein
MRMKAEIALEVDASDFIEAAEHQKKLELFLATLKELYPGAELRFWERRERTGAGGTAAARPARASARRVNAYDDL